MNLDLFTFSKCYKFYTFYFSSISASDNAARDLYKLEVDSDCLSVGKSPLLIVLLLGIELGEKTITKEVLDMQSSKTIKLFSNKALRNFNEKMKKFTYCPGVFEAAPERLTNIVIK
jgi:hypothetical protein